MSTARLLQAYFARKGFGFAVCGNNRASVSRFVAGIGHSRFRYARLELKGQIGVGVVNWDWGTGEWGNLPTCSHMATPSARRADDAAPFSRSVGSQDRIVARV